MGTKGLERLSRILENSDGKSHHILMQKKMLLGKEEKYL